MTETMDAQVTPGALAALRRVLLGRRVGSRLTVDDVRAELEASCITGNAIGAAFQYAVRLGWLSPIGYTPSRLRSARGRAVRVYRREAIGPQGIGPHARPARGEVLALW